MKREKIKQTMPFVVMTAAVFIASITLSCDRVNIYEFVTDKHPIIYAVTDTDDLTYTAIIRANDEGYFRMSETTVPSGFASLMDVDGEGTVFLYNGGTDTYIIDEEGQLTFALSPINVTGAASSSSGSFIFNNTLFTVYRYDRGSGAWSLYKTLGTTYSPYLVSADSDEGIIYFMASSGGQVYIWELESEAMPIPTFNIGPGGSYFERNGGSFFNAKMTATSLTLNGTYMGGFPSPVATGYAANDDGAFFASENDGTLAIYIFDGTTFSSVYSFSSTSGDVKLAGMKDGRLAVGISGSDMSEDGLYVFDYRKGSMRRLSSKPVYLMKVR